ncbi:MAG: YbaB/EbfC family nucleoid-associated protein [Chloroflexota bacterium]|nr:YbaB/EbfC family nucleoid-associated protein [Chloroflexota bacterium]
MGYGNLAKMAQQMQAEMAKVQAEIETMTVEGTAGGGAVKCVVNGHGELMSLTISPDAASDDVEMLQDLITAAVNDGVHQVKAQIDAKTARITGGMKMPGMPGMIG